MRHGWEACKHETYLSDDDEHIGCAIGSHRFRSGRPVGRIRFVFLLKCGVCSPESHDSIKVFVLVRAMSMVAKLTRVK